MAELRRSDIDFDRGVIKVRRGAVWLKGRTISGPPKTAAGARDVAFPPHLAPTIREHLATHAQWGKAGLLFPSQSGGPISPSSFFKPWRKARLAAGRPDLRFHDLRHGRCPGGAGGGHVGRITGPAGPHDPCSGDDLPARGQRTGQGAGRTAKPSGCGRIDAGLRARPSARASLAISLDSPSRH